jgi:hypothetical protein
MRVVRAASQAVWGYAEKQEEEEEDHSDKDEEEWHPESEEEGDGTEEGVDKQGESEDEGDGNKRGVEKEGESEDEGDEEEEEEEERYALRVVQEVWGPRNKNYPQRVFRVELSDGEIIKTVAEDCDHPDRGTAESNSYYQSVIKSWRAAGNSKPQRRQK